MFRVGHRFAFRNADTVFSCSFSMFVTILCIVTHYAPSVALYLPIFHAVCRTLNYNSCSSYSDSVSDCGECRLFLYCCTKHNNFIVRKPVYQLEHPMTSMVLMAVLRSSSLPPSHTLWQ